MLREQKTGYAQTTANQELKRARLIIVSWPHRETLPHCHPPGKYSPRWRVTLNYSAVKKERAWHCVILT